MLGIHVPASLAASAPEYITSEIASKHLHFTVIKCLDGNHYTDFLPKREADMCAGEQFSSDNCVLRCALRLNVVTTPSSCWCETNYHSAASVLQGAPSFNFNFKLKKRAKSTVWTYLLQGRAPPRSHVRT